MRHQRPRVCWVCQYPETAWWRLGPLTARSAELLVHSTSSAVVNSQNLVRVLAQPAAEHVAGVVPVAVPVPQTVVDDPGGNGVVVAFPQVLEQGRIEGWLSARPGVFHGLVRLAQDRDHVRGLGLQAAGPEPGDGAAAADDVLAALLDPGELAR